MEASLVKPLQVRGPRPAASDDVNPDRRAVEAPFSTPERRQAATAAAPLAAACAPPVSYSRPRALPLATDRELSRPHKMGNLVSFSSPSTEATNFHQLSALDIDKQPVDFASLAGKVGA